MKDLETKVDDLEKASEAANHENGLLKAQVERLQVELKEYRKRLSWISTNGVGRSNSVNNSTQKSTVNSSNDFQFEFPKFGDLPAMSSTNIFNNANNNSATQNRSSSLGSAGSAQARSNSVPKANSTGRSNSQGQAQRQSASQSPITGMYTGSPQSTTQPQSKGSVDSLTGLFSPSILEATRQASMGGYFPQPNSFAQNSRAAPNSLAGLYSNSTTSNSDSPGSSSESQNAVSSIGTSPEPSLSSPTNKVQDFNLNTIDENQMSNTFGKDELCKQLSTTCGCADDPIPPILNHDLSNESSLGLNNNTFNNLDGFNNTYDMNTSWLPADASTNFDPVLFGDYRETQDNILSQDFGSFFNDAYPLPDLGSPLHNYNEVVAPEQSSTGVAPANAKVDLIQQVDAVQNGLEEVVPNTDKPMTCNKIWYVLPTARDHRISTNSLTGIDCNQWRSSATARSTLTISVRNSAPRPSALKAVLSSIRRTLTRFLARLRDDTSPT